MADHLQMLPRKASHQGTARYFKGSVARNDEATTIIGRAVVAGENSGRQELSSSVYALLSLSTDMALLIVIDHKLHKIRNTQKAARRSLEGAFKRLVNDLAEEMGLDFRFHPKAYAALYEEFKSFGAAYFSCKFIITNNGMGSSLDSC